MWLAHANSSSMQMGGDPVDDTILTRHSDSLGRSNQMGEPRSMPDLGEGTRRLRPVPLFLTIWTDLRGLYMRVIEAVGSWPEGDIRYRLAQSGVSGMSIVINGKVLPPDMTANVITKRLALGDCDARRQVGLVMSEHVRADPDKFGAQFSCRSFVPCSVLSRRDGVATARAYACRFR